ncbi:hypothetical protein AB9F29_10260 [Falsihalocynthiibacter sp. S25ZX9]|uniref:hypothetical protein n=1 Tax=Falsihalocynthiibacter sp. S25ZX9 TaxID=3240870 RepID=UPI0035109CF3
MKNAFAHFSRLLLIVSFALSSAVAVAGSNDAGVFMEICADGVAETVRIDDDSNAVDPSHTCNDCVMCCLQIGADLENSFGQKLTFAQLKLKTDFASYQIPLIQKRGIRPNPRSPPLTEFSGRISTDTIEFTLKTQSDGRPYLKDAVA